MSQMLLPSHLGLCLDCKREIHLGVKGRRQRCMECAATRKREQNLARYYRVHSAKPKRCSVCHAVVPQKQRCSDYCMWIKQLRNFHYKIVLTIGDLKNVD